MTTRLLRCFVNLLRPHVRARFLASLMLTAMAAATVGCGGGGGPNRPNIPDPLEPGPVDPGPEGELTTAFQLAPQQPAQNADFVATLSYAITPATVRLGAYTVEIRFDPAETQFVSIDPAISTGRLVNTAGAAAGLIVVAGAVAQGFTDNLLFRATFRAVSGVTLDTFDVDLTEAYDTALRPLVD